MAVSTFQWKKSAAFLSLMIWVLLSDLQHLSSFPQRKYTLQRVSHQTSLPQDRCVDHRLCITQYFQCPKNLSEKSVRVTLPSEQLEWPMTNGKIPVFLPSAWVFFQFSDTCTSLLSYAMFQYLIALDTIESPGTTFGNDVIFVKDVFARVGQAIPR